jgi:hypothetical protein
MAYADQLARLRVAIETGRLPADLGQWALGELAAAAPRCERRRRRDELLRQAAALLPGSRWARARALAAELRALPRRQPPLMPLAQLLAAAVELDPRCPTSPRRLWEALDGDGSAASITDAASLEET